MTEIKTCDLLIVGGGGAGVIAAMEASQNRGLSVLLVSKGPIGQSGLTPTANGGTHTNRSAEEMFREAIVGGCFLNDQNLVWRMSSEIRNALGRLEDLDIPVAPLNPTAAVLPPVEALKKMRRVLLSRPNVTVMEDVLVTNLFRAEDAICGAGALRLTTGEFFAIKATAVVLATGKLWFRVPETIRVEIKGQLRTGGFRQGYHSPDRGAIRNRFCPIQGHRMGGPVH